MALIIAFEKSRRLSAAEPLVYIRPDLGGTLLLRAWFCVTIHRGALQRKAAPAPRRGFDACLTGAHKG